ncbi:hypothetical protein BDQ17DRAFT_1425661 [Cyathus striatus]|nr:hypothetical protein BDQ17DRAFT_1425661 [Cyathus striatus]
MATTDDMTSYSSHIGSTAALPSASADTEQNSELNPSPDGSHSPATENNTDGSGSTSEPKETTGLVSRCLGSFRP